MQLLVITHNPDRASFRQRVGVHLDRLRSKGIDAAVAALPDSLRGRHAVWTAARKTDGILLHRKMLNAWDGFCLRRCARPVIYDFDDALMYSDHRPERNSYIRWRRFRRSVALSHMVLAGNDYLAEHARRYRANVRILPTGLDVGAYRVSVPRLNDGLVRLVWIGSRSTLKYLHEIRPALEEVGRLLPHVVLRIVCDEFFDLTAMKVERRNWSKASEVADLLTSDIGLAPLPDDRFTRGKCGFKILQYQAAGLPVVASPIGVNAQYVREGATGFLARDPAQWVAKLRTLIENLGLRATLGQAGQSDVQRFDVNVIGERFCGLIAECLAPEHEGGNAFSVREHGAAN